MKIANAHRKIAALAACLGAALITSACAGQPAHPPQAEQCSAGLKTAYAELNFAKAKGFDGKVAWTKAAGLLSAAEVQKQFGKYPNCIDKVKRARYYIRESYKE